MSKRLLGLVELGRKKLAGINRAEFVRQALAEKLARHGLSVDRDALVVPDRVRALRHAVVMDEATPPPVTTTRADVKYAKPKRIKKP